MTTSKIKRAEEKKTPPVSPERSAVITTTCAAGACRAQRQRFYLSHTMHADALQKTKGKGEKKKYTVGKKDETPHDKGNLDRKGGYAESQSPRVGKNGRPTHARPVSSLSPCPSF